MLFKKLFLPFVVFICRTFPRSIAVRKSIALTHTSNLIVPFQLSIKTNQGNSRGIRTAPWRTHLTLLHQLELECPSFSPSLSTLYRIFIFSLKRKRVIYQVIIYLNNIHSICITSPPPKQCITQISFIKRFYIPKYMQCKKKNSACCLG